MKTFTKKRGFFAVAAALLLVTVMLVTTWCSNDIGSGNEYTDDFTPPAGKGAVRLSFNKNVARTILPEDVTDINQFSAFDFTFTPNTTGTLLSIRVAKADLDKPIILDPGTYALTVIGYINDSGTLVAMATTESSITVTITAGKTTKEGSIILKVYTPGGSGDKGKFSYTLTGLSTSDFGTGDTATITITPIGGSSPIFLDPPTNSKTSLDIDDKFGGSAQVLTLDTGYYYVDFELKIAGDPVNFRHVVHIYKNMTSAYTFNVTLSYFNAVFLLEDDAISFDPLTDKNPNISFSTDDGTTWTLYSTTPPTTPPSISLYRGTTIKFKVNNYSSTYTANSIEWYCLSNTALNTATNDICTISTTGLPLGGPDPDNPYSVSRDYNLTVAGTVDGTKYATVVPFSVTVSSSLPVITSLTSDTWNTTGSLAVGGTQWFSFTSTNTTQYIHADDIDASLTDGIDIQIYINIQINGSGDTTITKVGTTKTLPDTGNNYVEITSLTTSTQYYIKVTPHISGKIGTYKIGFSTTTSIP